MFIKDPNDALSILLLGSCLVKFIGLYSSAISILLSAVLDVCISGFLKFAPNKPIRKDKNSLFSSI